MVAKDIVMPHLRSQRAGQRSAWKFTAVEGAHQSPKNALCPDMKVEPSTSAQKKYSHAVKPSMSLQYIDEGSEKRLEAAFKSVIKYSLSTETTDFAKGKVPNVKKKQNLVDTSIKGPGSLSKIEIDRRMLNKKKLPSPKPFDGIVFSLVSDTQLNLSHFNSVHRCKTCSVSCNDFLGEFWGFPDSDINMDTGNDGTTEDEPGGSGHGFDFEKDEIGEFYGFEETNNDNEKFVGHLEVSGLRPCSVVLYRVKPCTVVLHRLKYTHEKNVGPYNWQFPPQNNKLVRKAKKKRSGATRKVKKRTCVTIKQENDNMDMSQFTLLSVKNNILFEPINNISVSVWDQFQEACNLSLQKEYVEDFCGFGHLNKH